jgi:hypothetical protein
MKFLAIILFVAATALAETPWQLTTADLNTQSVDVRKLDDSGLDYVDNDGHAHHLASDRLVEMRRTTPAEISSTQWLLILSDGERWAGDVTGMTGEQISWQSPLLGQMTIPLRRVAGIIHQGNSSNPEANINEDIVHLANGDAVHGVITGMTSENVSVQTSGTPATIPWSAIATIRFASLSSDLPTTQPNENWRVSLDDESILQAAAIAWADNRAELTVDGTKGSVAASHIMAVEQLHGPVLFLASQSPTENVQIPLLGSPWAARMGMDLDGNALSEAISVHAYSRLGWNIPPGFEKFHVQYMIPSDLSFADVTVRIQIDGKNVYEQTHQHGGTVSPPVDLPLNQGQRLVLEVDTSNPYRTQGWLTWISPALLR